MIDDNQALINYMLGHVIMSGNLDPRELTAEHLSFAFSTLPTPKVSLVEFKACFGNSEPDRLTEEQELDHNQANINKGK